MKILVVDDQQLNRSLLQHMLKNEGYEVVLANDGLQAIEVYQQELPDIILLDVVMPNMDGYETAPKLKELAGDVYLPIIFITALGDQESLKRCLDVGGDDFLNKPFDRVILQAKIQAHWRIRDLSIKTFEQKKQLDFYRLQTEREHKIVEHIFHRAVDGNYKAPHLLDCHLSPASMFNGDILLAALGPSGNLYVMVGDFTGHGLAAAVGTLPVSRTFYAMTQKGLAVGDIAKEINEVLLSLLPDDMFCAASIVELNSSGKSLSVWAGGTPDMYLLENGKGITQTINSQHMALGILENDEFDIASDNFAVTNKETLIMFTDGLVELFNEQGEMLGYERLVEFIDGSEDICTDSIIDHINEFRGNVEADDDITLLTLICDQVESDIDQQQTYYSKLPHQFSVSLDSNAMQCSDPVVEIIDMLSYMKGAQDHRSTLFLLLSEAYNNALDHGILGLDSKLKDQEDGFIEYYSLRDERLRALDSGEITIRVNYHVEEKCLYITVKDSGAGFDLATVNQHQQGDQEHGRGNLLLQELANSISYNQQGNEITFGYLLNQ